jgi:hypothetical protein
MNETPKAPRQSVRVLLRSFLTIVAVAGIMIALPFAFVAALFWAADGSWDFEGRGVRYWLFVKGTRLERLGVVEPAPGGTKYSISLQEGNFPGWNIAVYESAAPPEKIIDVYAARCCEMKLKVIEKKSNPEAPRAELTCEIEVYLNVEVLAERKAEAASTRVFVKVWGSE